MVIEAVNDSVSSERLSLMMVKTGLANVVPALSVKLCLVPLKSTFSVKERSFLCDRYQKST